MRLAVVVSHPIQYYSPLFREMAGLCDLTVFYAWNPDAEQLGSVGFGTAFAWDVDLLSGYRSVFLENVSAAPGTEGFGGCDTPGIAAKLEDGNFDAVLIFGWFLKSHLQALLSARRLGIPAFVRGDSNLAVPHGRLKLAVKSVAMPIFLRLYAAALYVGERSREFYRAYRYPEHRLFFSPHCVDTQWFAARSSPDERKRMRAELDLAPEMRAILFAGKLVDRKRPIDAVRALALLRAGGRDVALLVAGSGELEDEVRRLAGENGVPCHMLGFCNQTQMPPVYAAADALVLPSNGEETWGLVANEALACGTPVIVSDACGCAPDLAEDGSAGRVFRTGDVDDLARAIASLLDDPPGAAAIRARSDAYSLASAAAGVMEAMRATTGRRR